MSGWQWGGWPPPAPGDAGGISFAAVKAALALADSPVGFNNQRITDVGQAVYAGDVVTVAMPLAQVNYEHGAAPVTVAPAATVVHGPAGWPHAGGVCRLPQHAATPAVTATLQPSGLLLQRATSLGGATATGVLLVGTGILTLGFGETVSVLNTGTASFQLWYTYHDIPATNRTLVRVQYSNTPVVVIPAAAAGFYNKMVGVTVMQAASAGAAVLRMLEHNFNDDTAAITNETYLGGQLINRVGPQAANFGGRAEPVRR